MNLSKNQVDDVCGLGNGEKTCAFLLLGAGGMECAKRSGVEKVIRSRLSAGTMVAKGDNCSGPPLWRRPDA